MQTQEINVLKVMSKLNSFISNSYNKHTENILRSGDIDTLLNEDLLKRVSQIQFLNNIIDNLSGDEKIEVSTIEEVYLELHQLFSIKFSNDLFSHSKLMELISIFSAKIEDIVKDMKLPSEKEMLSKEKLSESIKSLINVSEFIESKVQSTIETINLLNKNISDLEQEILLLRKFHHIILDSISFLSKIEVNDPSINCQIEMVFKEVNNIKRSLNLVDEKLKDKK